MMHGLSTAWGSLAPDQPLGPMRLPISAAANERYWRAAGVDHPLLGAGALYPPIAANLTILCFQQTCPDAMIQTRQRLQCHRRAPAGGDLITFGRVVARYEKRGREYVDIVGHVHAHCNARIDVMERAMTWEVTDELVRAYSRRGNFHSDAETAAALGMPGLVAQGVQVAGPAYGMLLDAWGDDFLEHGEIDLRFVGMVVAGDTIEARIDIAADLEGAVIEVTNTSAGRAAVVGQARRE